MSTLCVYACRCACACYGHRDMDLITREDPFRQHAPWRCTIKKWTIKTELTHFVPLRRPSVANIHLLELLTLKRFRNHVLDMPTIRDERTWLSSITWVCVPAYVHACMYVNICVSMRVCKYTCKAGVSDDDRLGDGATERSNACRMGWVCARDTCLMVWLPSKSASSCSVSGLRGKISCRELGTRPSTFVYKHTCTAKNILRHE